jgi:hypothetical protein
VSFTAGDQLGQRLTLEKPESPQRTLCMAGKPESNENNAPLRQRG